MDREDQFGSRLSRARAAVNEARGSDKKVLADALRALGNIERRPEHLREDANRSYAEAAAIYRELNQPLDEAWVRRHMGINHEYAERLDEAEAAYENALELYRQHSKNDDLDYANAVRYVAVIKMRLGKRDESEVLWREAVERYERCGITEGVAEGMRHLEQLARDRT